VWRACPERTLANAGTTVGTYLALAALNRLVDPCSKRAFEKWWRTTAADQFITVPAALALA
jgi:hypothetical protein